MLDQIGDHHRNSKFAIIIDEAHSSQGGRTALKMNMVLAESTSQYGKAEPELDRLSNIINAFRIFSLVKIPAWVRSIGRQEHPSGFWRACTL